MDNQIVPAHSAGPIPIAFDATKERMQAVFPSIHTMRDILACPTDFGLQEGDISPLVIQAGLHGLQDHELCETLKRHRDENGFAAFSLSLRPEHKNGFNPLHFCAYFNMFQTAKYLTSYVRETESTHQGLTHTHIAAVLGHTDYLRSHFDTSPSLETIEINLSPDGSYVYLTQISELTTAMLSGQNDTARMILDHARISPYSSHVKHFGSLVHLAIYSKDLSLLKKVLMKRYKDDRAIVTLLTEPDFQSFSPLRLAADLEWIGGLDYLIEQVMLHAEAMNGSNLFADAFYHSVSQNKFEALSLFLLRGYIPDPKTSNQRRTISIVLTKADNGDDLARSMMASIEKAQKKEYDFGLKKAFPRTQLYQNLACQGGGGRGLAYVYALKHLKSECSLRAELEENDALLLDNIKRVVGSSAGAIFAFAFALGYSEDVMLEKLDFDLADFMEGSDISRLMEQFNLNNTNDVEEAIFRILKEVGVDIQSLFDEAKKMLNTTHPVMHAASTLLFRRKKLLKKFYDAISQIKDVNKTFEGFSSGQRVLEFLESLLESKGFDKTMTFGDLAQIVKEHPDQYKHLHIIVTNFDRQNTAVFSSENKNHRDYLIVDVVRASMSIPLVFKPHRLRAKEILNQVSIIEQRPDRYVDGGCLRNYAIDEFDKKMYTKLDDPGDPHYPVHNKATLGLRFKSDERGSRPPETVLQYLVHIVDFYYRAESVIQNYADAQHGREYGRSIVLDTGEIGLFTIRKFTKDEKIFLDQSAKKAVEAYFNLPSNARAIARHGALPAPSSTAGPANTALDASDGKKPSAMR